MQQVHQALRLGLLEPGDQLPTAQQVVAKLAINPNTVLKAYRELEREGLVRARPGLGTFVVGTLPRTDPRRSPVPRVDDRLAAKARAAGPRRRRHRGDLPHRGSRLLRGGGGMTAVIEAERARQAYGRRWALRDCTLAIPAGRVVGWSARTAPARPPCCTSRSGCSTPTAGTIAVLGATSRPSGPTQLGRVGFVAQDTPTYARLSVADHLRMGAWLNPSWDAELADAGSSGSASTRASGPARCPAASARSSRSRWRSRSGPSC